MNNRLVTVQRHSLTPIEKVTRLKTVRPGKEETCSVIVTIIIKFV
jgi:hypothetical protein